MQIQSVTWQNKNLHDDNFVKEEPYDPLTDIIAVAVTCRDHGNPLFR